MTTLLSSLRAARVRSLAAAALLLPVLPLAAQSPSTPPVSAGAAAAPAVHPGPTPTPTPAPRTAESAVTPISHNPSRHQEFLDRIKDGKIDLLFVGDSITDFWPRRGEATYLKFAPYHPADFGISGETTEEVLWRLTNGELDGFAPKAAVVMIGTNNIGRYRDEKPEWAAAGVKKIVDTIHEKQPQTKVLLLAVFPRGHKADTARAKVAAINAEISKLDDGKTVRYLDIGHVFLDPQGEIPHDVMPDGLHPSAKGYDLWYDAMQPTLEEMMK